MLVENLDLLWIRAVRDLLLLNRHVFVSRIIFTDLDDSPRDLVDLIVSKLLVIAPISVTTLFVPLDAFFEEVVVLLLFFLLVGPFFFFLFLAGAIFFFCVGSLPLPKRDRLSQKFEIRRRELRKSIT